MRAIFIVILLALLMLSPLTSEDAEAYPSDGVILDMVCPTGESEGFSLRNMSLHDADLMNFFVIDGEGTVSFTESIILRPGESVTVLAAEPEEWMLISDFIVYGDRGIVNDGFALNDKGDDIHVCRTDGTIVDSFVYGDSEPSGLWTDEPFVTIGKCEMAVRNKGSSEPYDGEEWRIHVPGRTQYHFSRTFEDCEVRPFSFPESDGRPVIEAIQQAQDSVIVSMYDMDERHVASALKDACIRGLEVKLLMEGSPAGGIDTDELGILKSLYMSGAEVHIMKSTDSYKRFSYLHAKYAVIDDTEVIVTSENWTESGFHSNRGWGAIIAHPGFADYVTEVFESDLHGSDIHGFDELYPTALPMILGPSEPVSTDIRPSRADVTAVLSPDYSRETLMEFLDSAEERIYSQQLDVQHSWVFDDGSPLSLMEEKHEQGLDVRLQVDVSYDSPYDDDTEDGYGIYSHYQNYGGMDMRYSVWDGTVHNKGIIVDDRVWLGSVNWTDSSLDDNRELAVIIGSEDVADYFSKLFISDWGPGYNGHVDLDVGITEYDGRTHLDASGSSVPFGSEFRWDLDGDGESEATGMTAEWTFCEATECTLTAVTPEGEVHSITFTVGSVREDGGSGGFMDGPLKYIPAMALVAMIIAVKRIKTVR